MMRFGGFPRAASRPSSVPSVPSVPRVQPPMGALANQFRDGSVSKSPGTLPCPPTRFRAQLQTHCPLEFQHTCRPLTQTRRSPEFQHRPAAQLAVPDPEFLDFSFSLPARFPCCTCRPPPGSLTGQSHSAARSPIFRRHPPPSAMHVRCRRPTGMSGDCPPVGTGFPYYNAAVLWNGKDPHIS